jgi:shikimate dehydrogenase
MRKYGLIGYPLGHSFSKKYFTEKFQTEGISDCCYDNYPLKDLSQFPKLISENTDLYGLNVTIPYKTDIIEFLDTVDSEAMEIGAVNVLKILRYNGKVKLSGFNSDVTGIRDTLMPYISPEVRCALVLGTGGSSRSVCYVLAKLGLEVTLVSRKRSPGIIAYSDIDARLLNSTELLVNTTPLGMSPDIESKPDINYTLLSERHVLFDLVYNPEQTAFLKMGKMQGCLTIGGLKMLHSQAERSWQIWNDNNL